MIEVQHVLDTLEKRRQDLYSTLMVNKNLTSDEKLQLLSKIQILEEIKKKFEALA